MLELIASVALAASSPPAPTIIWRDGQASGYYVRGLTRQGTAVEVQVNGRAIGGIRYGAARGGTASFAVPLPNLEPGLYRVSAQASYGQAQSQGSEPLTLVVPGLRLAPPRLA